MATIHHAAKKRRRGRTGHNLPLKLVPKWNVPAQRLTKGGPLFYQMVVVTSLYTHTHTRLSFAGIFCSKFFFSPRFVTLKETFPSSSFGALRDDYTAGFSSSSSYFSHDNSQQNQANVQSHWFARVCTSCQDTKTTQIIQRSDISTLLDRKSFHPSTERPNANHSQKVGVGDFDRCAPICLHTCCVISSLAFLSLLLLIPLFKINVIMSTKKPHTLFISWKIISLVH